MADKQLLTPLQQRKKAAETAWLHYFNQVLFEQNIITENQRNQMAGKIAVRKSSSANPTCQEFGF